MERYLRYLGRLLHGDLGRSYIQRPRSPALILARPAGNGAAGRWRDLGRGRHRHHHGPTRAPILPLAALAVFAGHLGGGAQWTLSSYGLQRAAPDAIRGRVFSFDYGLVTLTITLSTLVAGFLAERFSPAATTWSMVSLAAIAAIGWVAFARPVWRRAGG